MTRDSYRRRLTLHTSEGLRSDLYDVWRGRRFAGKCAILSPRGQHMHYREDYDAYMRILHVTASRHGRSKASRGDANSTKEPPYREILSKLQRDDPLVVWNSRKWSRRPLLRSGGNGNDSALRSQWPSQWSEQCQWTKQGLTIRLLFQLLLPELSVYNWAGDLRGKPTSPLQERGSFPWTKFTRCKILFLPASVTILPWFPAVNRRSAWRITPY